MRIFLKIPKRFFKFDGYLRRFSWSVADRPQVRLLVEGERIYVRDLDACVNRYNIFCTLMIPFIEDFTNDVHSPTNSHKILSNNAKNDTQDVEKMATNVCEIKKVQTI